MTKEGTRSGLRIPDSVEQLLSHPCPGWLIIIVVGLCSCATPYRPAKSGKGYSDSQISTNEFEASFRGNGQTDLARATDFVLLRAAQVTLQHGFSHFSVMDVTNTSSARRYTVHQQFYSPVSPETGWPPLASGDPWAYPPGYIVQYDEPRIYFQPGTILRIKCFAAKPEKPFTFDAAGPGTIFEAKVQAEPGHLQAEVVTNTASDRRLSQRARPGNRRRVNGW